MDKADLIAVRKVESPGEGLITLYAPTGPGHTLHVTSFDRSKVEYITDTKNADESEIKFMGDMRVAVRLPRAVLEKKIYKTPPGSDIDLTEETRPTLSPLPSPAYDPNEYTRISIFDAEDCGDTETIPLMDDSEESSDINLFDFDESNDDTSLGAGLLEDVYGPDRPPLRSAGLFEMPEPLPLKSDVPEKPRGVLSRIFNSVFSFGSKKHTPKTKDQKWDHWK
jgi:hypothetical protein